MIGEFYSKEKDRNYLGGSSRVKDLAYDKSGSLNPNGVPPER